MNNLKFEPFLSCLLVEKVSTLTFKDLPNNTLFTNEIGIAFMKINDTEAVNLYHQQVQNFGPRKYTTFDGKTFTFSELDTPVLLLKFYA